MYSTVLQYLEDTSNLYPDKIAFADTKSMYSFKELEYSAKRIGSTIMRYVAPHNPIVVYMDRQAYNVIAFLGVTYAGSFYVPLDSQMPAERIRLILETLCPSMILYDDVTKCTLEKLKLDVKTMNYQDALKFEIDNAAINNIRMHSKNTDLLYVLFTSGSTGVPKGVTISHAAVIDLMEWICNTYNLNEETTLCNQAPFYFDASVPDLYIPLKVGATVYMPPKSYYTFPKKVVQYIKEKDINTLIWVPSALCNVVNCKAFEVCVPKSIQLVIFCGEIMPCKHLNIWKKYLPYVLYVNMYGPTEATYACMYYNVERDFADEDKLPLGKACENSEIILLNEKNKLTAEGDIGEICILGQCLSQGYYNAPQKTSSAFMQNPINTKWTEFMYRTGDMAYRTENGDIIFAGRKDYQIKRLGHRIELGEIENVILSIDIVENACCVYNDNKNKIVAVYTGKIDVDELNAVLSSKLPHYMMPSKIIKLNAMPMNLNGKIDRQKLKNNYMEEL